MQHKTLLTRIAASGALALALLGVSTPAHAATSPTTLPIAGVFAQQKPQLPAEIGDKLVLVALTRATADLTGQSVYAVTKLLRDGQSLTAIAAASGKTSAEVIATARATISTRLARAVTNGVITQQRADVGIAAFDQLAPAQVARTDVGTATRSAAARAALIQATAEVTGLSPKTIIAELKGGKTIAQIAQSQGKTAADVLAKLAELQQTRTTAVTDEARHLVEEPGAGRP